MAAFYIDHDVAQEVARLLQSAGHNVVTVRDLRTPRDRDAQHLLLAATESRILITHNARDYQLLHDAWRRWQDHWSLAIPHAGIAFLPHVPPKIAFPALSNLSGSGVSLPNELYTYSQWAGWVRWQ